MRRLVIAGLALVLALTTQFLVSPSASNASSPFAWPTSGRISQYWGPGSYSLESPYTYHGTYYRHFHRGVDIAASCGRSVYASHPGRVIYAGWNSMGGNEVRVAYGSLVFDYAHLMTRYVSYGQSVGWGRRIGRVGSTGTATGCHLHFGMRVAGSWENPLRYLNEPVAWHPTYARTVRTRPVVYMHRYAHWRTVCFRAGTSTVGYTVAGKRSTHHWPRTSCAHTNVLYDIVQGHAPHGHFYHVVDGAYRYWLIPVSAVRFT